MEAGLNAQGRSLSTLSPAEMEQAWAAAKAGEPDGRRSSP
jgi:hypothetical protein